MHPNRMNPLTPTQPRPRDRMSIREAQAILDASIARRRHEAAFEAYQSGQFDTISENGKISIWPATGEATHADTRKPTNGTTLTGRGTGKPANIQPPEKSQ